MRSSTAKPIWQSPPSALILIANFTAFVAAELTVANLNASINSVEDLRGKRVATVIGTTSSTYLREQGISFRPVEVIEDAYDLLSNKTIDAIVYDAPVLQYYAATTSNGELTVVGSPFNREDYGIALPSNSPYEEPINQAILELKFNGTYEETLNRWFISEGGE